MNLLLKLFLWKVDQIKKQLINYDGRVTFHLEAPIIGKKLLVSILDAPAR